MEGLRKYNLHVTGNGLIIKKKNSLYFLKQIVLHRNNHFNLGHDV